MKAKDLPDAVFDFDVENLGNLIDATGDCWEWRLSLVAKGYGRKGFRIDGVKYSVPAHRWVYQLLVGRIQNDLVIDHLCRNRACVNPDHLEPVTHAENLARGRSRFNKQGQTHCKRGHDLTDSYQYPGKSRNCRKCTKARTSARYYAKKASA